MPKKGGLAKTDNEWSSQFRSHVLACRASGPLTGRDDLSPAEEWQCSIVGSSLLNWLRKIGPRFLQERAVMSKMLGIDPEPFIVFTSDISGLVADQQILGPDHERVGARRLQVDADFVAEGFLVEHFVRPAVGDVDHQTDCLACMYGLKEYSSVRRFFSAGAGPASIVSGGNQLNI